MKRGQLFAESEQSSEWDQTRMPDPCRDHGSPTCHARLLWTYPCFSNKLHRSENTGYYRSLSNITRHLYPGGVYLSLALSLPEPAGKRELISLRDSNSTPHPPNPNRITCCMLSNLPPLPSQGLCEKCRVVLPSASR
ncbi:hypothetical protein RRG08_021217 [Elysia crispata]|uniref:Uncharacterized protein n=1 Tax=Elysia crispata TaxID=231223 RepID=A0AAE1D6J5_9GAST|nr:hypothetical protein RRG08_021217 [Elysia crispata]